MMDCTFVVCEQESSGTDMDFKLAAYQEFRALLSHGFLQDIRERYLVRCAENIKAHNDVYFSLHIMVCLIVAYRIPVLGDKVRCSGLALFDRMPLKEFARTSAADLHIHAIFASAMRCYLFFGACALDDLCLFAQNPELHTPPAVVQTMETKFSLRDLVVADIVDYQKKACARYTQLCEESMMEVFIWKWLSLSFVSTLFPSTFVWIYQMSGQRSQ
jgi:hypothetical protein